MKITPELAKERVDKAAVEYPDADLVTQIEHAAEELAAEGYPFDPPSVAEALRDYALGKRGDGYDH